MKVSRLFRTGFALALGLALLLPALPASAATTDTIISAGPCSTAGSCTSDPFDPAGFKSVSFDYFAQDGSTAFACTLDGGASFPCGTADPNVTDLGGFEYEWSDAAIVLAEGSHTFTVAASTDASPASRTWTVDTVVPAAPSITSGPTIKWNSRTAVFTFDDPTATEPVTFKCLKDDPDLGSFQDRTPLPAEPAVSEAGWSDCTSPYTWSSIADGTHSFSVVAVDQAGNGDPSVFRKFKVDATAPNTSIDIGPGAFSTADVTYSFSSDENGTFECSLDAAAYSACTDPITYIGLADGSHTFSVRAIDSFGNVDLTPATHTWTVDTTPPDTTITAGPTLAGTTTQFSFTSDDSTATFECQLDGGGYAACTSPKSYPGLVEGTVHTFDVRAIDQFARVDATPATKTWMVDFTPPDTFIDSGPSGTVNVTDATFTFHSDDGTATFECKLDGAAYAACVTPKTYLALSEGSHTFIVRAVDVNGLIDATPASRTWTVFTLADVNLTKSGIGTGLVTSSPAGINCGTACTSDSASFTANSSVTLTANPDPGWVFTGWSGACTGFGDCVLTMSADRNVQAHFGEVSYQPDAMLRRAGGGMYKGDDIYEADASSQMLRLKVRAGQSRAFDLAFQNDGLAPDRFSLESCDLEPGYRVKFLHDGTDITNRTHAGTYMTPSLAPGEVEVYRFVIATSSNAKADFRCDVRAVSSQDGTRDMIQPRVYIA